VPQVRLLNLGLGCLLLRLALTRQVPLQLLDSQVVETWKPVAALNSRRRLMRINSLPNLRTDGTFPVVFDREEKHEETSRLSNISFAKVPGPSFLRVTLHSSG
jgi:hypothetical protein